MPDYPRIDHLLFDDMAVSDAAAATVGYVKAHGGGGGGATGPTGPTGATGPAGAYTLDAVKPQMERAFERLRGLWHEGWYTEAAA